MKQNMKEAIGLSLKRYNDTYMKAANDRIDNIVSQAGTDNTEIVDARIDSAGVTHTTLNNRILAETKMNDQHLVSCSGEHITAENTMGGSITNLEVLGNTIQNEEDLADIKSVGELQEDGTYKMSILSCGKNLINNSKVEKGFYVQENNSNVISNNGFTTSNYIKIKPNTKYVLNKLISYKAFYDRNKNIIPINPTYDVNTFTTPTNASYVRISVSNANDITTYQLEEGTVATEYEPYQENKCDILLPCQLEKVGDVSDRLYYDDVEKAWCIEKNIVDMLFNETNCTISMSSASDIHPNYAVFDFSVVDNKNYVKTSVLFCDKFNHLRYSADRNSSDKEGCWIGNAVFFTVKILKSKLESVDANGMKKWLKANNINLKYLTTQPQFIPLPRDIQIQLNSFFGTTHIYMESGEVEGTIKCKIPKSIGATVQSLNNKTDILSDRIEAIEGLKDSQNMKYETDKGYLVCKETKNGVIDDLKIEGKTLVNLFQFKDIVVVGEVNLYATINTSYKGIHQNKTLTIINNTNKQIIVDIFNDTSWVRSIIVRSYEIAKAFSVEGDEYVKQIYGQGKDGWGIGEADKKLLRGTLVLLEGDHTQNPPSYFEGLMSVGQDVDKIEVLSVKGDGNLISSECKVGTLFEVYAPKGEYVASCKSKQCTIRFYRKDKTLIDYWSLNGEETIYRSFVALEDIYYVLFDGDVNTTDIQLIKGNTPKPYTPHQSDKKQILFYNENGELKPVAELHKWDSIEKHSDNKWYYHKRSGKRSYQTEDENNSNYITDMTNTVYQLAQEEVYELAPLHLDSYANETLILCNSGAISPKMEFSITSHINELVKAYGERVNLLEEKVYQYMVTQNRMQLASTYSADSVTFKVDYFSLCGDEENYDEDLYNLILNNILVGKDNYDYDKMFTIILDYASWNQISWEQFDILVGLMDIQHNPPVEELPTEDEIEEDIIEEETPVE